MPRRIREYTCRECGKPFQSREKDPVVCSKECHNRSLGQRGFRRWKPEEVEILERWAGEKPLPNIVSAIQRLDKKMGWEVRTHRAVEGAMRRRGLSAYCTEDNLTVSEIARMLNVSVRCIFKHWENKGLKIRRVSRRQTAISLKDFQEWAKAHTHLLRGLDRDALAWLLNDELLAKRLSESEINRHGLPVKIMRLDTKEVFDSLKDAGEKSYIRPEALSRHWRKIKNRPGPKRFVSCGIEWEVLVNNRRASA